jgi:hypothetical protein
MKRLVLLFQVVSLLVVGACVLPATAADRRDTKKDTKKEIKKVEMFAVVQIGEEFKAIPMSGLKDEKKRVEDDYKAAVKEWPEARKKDPKAPHPIKLTVKVLKQNIKGQEEADKYKQQLEEQAEKSGKKKPAATIR